MSFQNQKHKILKFQNYLLLKLIFDPNKINLNQEMKNGIERKIKLRIFGKNFVNKNKYKYRIIYENKEYKLHEFFEEIDKDYNYNDLIKLKLRIFNNITNMSYMNDGCNTLVSISETNEIKEKISQKIIIVSTDNTNNVHGYYSISSHLQSKTPEIIYKNNLCKPINPLMSLDSVQNYNSINFNYLNNLIKRDELVPNLSNLIVIDLNHMFYE